MEMKRIPASEVVRSTELVLQRAASLRSESKRILAEAEAIEVQARLGAIEAMGNIRGSAAYEMALWSVSEDSIDEKVQASPSAVVSLSQAAVVDVSEVTPVVVAAVDPEPSPSIAVVSAPKAVITPAALIVPAPIKKQEKVELFGIEIPPSRFQEGEEIVETARSYISQGRKSNPFGNDRGKNSWRKTLFNAAWADLNAKAAPVAVTEVIAEPPVATPSEVTLEAVSSTERSPEVPSVVEEPIKQNDQAVLDHDDDLDSSDFDGLDDSLEWNLDEIQTEDFIGEVDVDFEDEAVEEELSNSDYDPLDDLDAPVVVTTNTPPVVAPPRAYPAGATVIKDDKPLVADMDPVLPQKTVERPAIPSVVRPPVSAPIHTPGPVPSTRRPGTGQAMQSPPTLPSLSRPGLEAPPRGAQSTTPVPPSMPSFMKRR